MKAMKLFSILSLVLFLLLGKVFATSSSFIPIEGYRNDVSMWFEVNYTYFSPSYKRALDLQSRVVEEVFGRLKNSGEIEKDMAIRIHVISGAFIQNDGDIVFEKYDLCPSISGASGLESPDRITRKPCTVIRIPQVEYSKLRETLVVALLQSKSLYKEQTVSEGVYKISQKKILGQYKERVKEFDEITAQKHATYSPLNIWKVVEKTASNRYSLEISHRGSLLRTLSLEKPLMRDPIWSEKGYHMVLVVPDGFYVFYAEAVLLKFYGFEELNNYKYENVFVTDTFVEFSPTGRELLVVNDRGLFVDYFGVILDLWESEIIFNRSLLADEWDYSGRKMVGFPWNEEMTEGGARTGAQIDIFGSDFLVQNIQVQERFCSFVWKE